MSAFGAMKPRYTLRPLEASGAANPSQTVRMLRPAAPAPQIAFADEPVHGRLPPGIALALVATVSLALWAGIAALAAPLF